MKKIVPDNAILIPDHAERVFSGVIFDVYQWRQEMFDGSTQTFEMVRRPDTVQCIVVRDGQILLIEDAQPGKPTRTHLPGGRADKQDEYWLATAKRELREEIGLVCDNWRLISVVQPESKLEWFGAIYLATDIVAENEAAVDSGGERIKPMWRDYAEVREEVLHGKTPSMRYLLQFFNRVPDVDALMALPEFTGREVDR